MSDDGNNVGDNAIFDSAARKKCSRTTRKMLSCRSCCRRVTPKCVTRFWSYCGTCTPANTKLANSMTSCRKNLIDLLFKLASKKDDATCAKLATQCLTTRLLEHKPDTFKRIVDDASSVLSKCVAAVHTRSPSEVLPDVQGMLGMLAVLTLVS